MMRRTAPDTLSLPRTRSVPFDRVLFLQMNKLGDSLVMTPMFEAIKRRWPEARIHVIASRAGAEVFEHNPFIDALVATKLDPQQRRRDLPAYWALCRRQLRAWGITTVICDVVNTGPWPALLLQLLRPRHAVVAKRFRGQRLLARGLTHLYPDVDTDRAHDRSTLAYNLGILDALGVRGDGLRARVFPNGEERARAHAAVDALGLDGSRPTIAFAPYTRNAATAWPAEHVREFAERAARAYNVLVTGGVADGERWAREHGAHVPAARPLFGLSLRETSVALDRADVVVAMNTGVSHLFQSLRVPMVRLDSGHSPPLLWSYRDDPRFHVLEHATPCAPCLLAACPVAGHPCMREITPAVVLARVAAVLAAERRAAARRTVEPAEVAHAH